MVSIVSDPRLSPSQYTPKASPHARGSGTCSPAVFSQFSVGAISVHFRAKFSIISRLRDAGIKDRDRGHNHDSHFRAFILDTSEIPVDSLTDSPN